MTREDAGSDDVALDGLELDAAVDAVVEADETLDRGTVRETLERVSDDGVVHRSAAPDVIEDLSDDVQKARNQANMASLAFSKVEDAASALPDVDVVERRIEGFGAEVDGLTDRAAELGDRHESLQARADDPDSLSALVADVSRATVAAEDLERDAISLTAALEDFEEWVDDPQTWVNDLQMDLHTIEGTLDTLEAVAEDLSSFVASVDGDEGDAAEADHTAEGGDATEEGAATKDDVTLESVETDDPGAAWLDATLRVQVAALMLDDVRTELTGLHTLAERGGMAEPWYPENVIDQLEDVDDRRERLADRLDDVARPAWVERFDDRLAAFESALAGTDPPVDWVDLQVTLDEYLVTEAPRE